MHTLFSRISRDFLEPLANSVFNSIDTRFDTDTPLALIGALATLVILSAIPYHSCPLSRTSPPCLRGNAHIVLQSAPGPIFMFSETSLDRQS